MSAMDEKEWGGRVGGIGGGAVEGVEERRTAPTTPEVGAWRLPTIMVSQGYRGA